MAILWAWHEEDRRNQSKNERQMFFASDVLPTRSSSSSTRQNETNWISPPGRGENYSRPRSLQCRWKFGEKRNANPSAPEVRVAPSSLTRSRTESRKLPLRYYVLDYQHGHPTAFLHGTEHTVHFLLDRSVTLEVGFSHWLGVFGESCPPIFEPGCYSIRARNF